MTESCEFRVSGCESNECKLKGEFLIAEGSNSYGTGRSR